MKKNAVKFWTDLKRFLILGDSEVNRWFAGEQGVPERACKDSANYLKKVWKVLSTFMPMKSVKRQDKIIYLKLNLW